MIMQQFLWWHCRPENVEMKWDALPSCLAQGSKKYLNPSTPKIWLLILSSSCYTFPCELVTRIWCSIKIISCTWVISLPVCWIMYGYCWEKLHVNHFWVLKGWDYCLMNFNESLFFMNNFGNLAAVCLC